jgi:hypothetical protein
LAGWQLPLATIRALTVTLVGWIISKVGRHEGQPRAE